MKSSTRFFSAFFILVIIIVLNHQTLYAEILFEPYLGYESGVLSQSGQTDIKTKGMNYGARLGYYGTGLKLGLDYMTASQKADQDGISGDYKPKDIGLFVGYQFIGVLQIYASYFLTSKAKIQPESYPNDFSGKATRFGIGLMTFPLISINLEAIYRTYDKYNDIKLTDSIKGKAIALSVSLPFNI